MGESFVFWNTWNEGDVGYPVVLQMDYDPAVRTERQVQLGSIIHFDLDIRKGVTTHSEPIWLNAPKTRHKSTTL